MLLSAWAFSRWMALIYLAAFWSLGVQVIGLIGSHGVLPIGDFLHAVADQEGLKHFWAAPTLCWFNSSDGFLLFLCWGGVVLSLLLLAGILPGLMAFLLWLFYLSLTTVGQDFLGFQWDSLLLEAGFLLIFLYPWNLQLHLRPSVHPSRVIVWLLRWLLFRLMFESGLVKLLSGDLNWWHLTALTYHYWTQPLPNVISWYANQLPLWFQKVSCLFVFVVELGMPLLIFWGRAARRVAFVGIIALQLLIMLTGNYCFFNLMVIGLCLTLVDDDVKNDTVKHGLLYQFLTNAIAVFIVMISLSLMANSFLRLSLPPAAAKLVDVTMPWRSVNNYGLFAVMTTQRNEIILEGSNDGEHWLPYEFRYKPGDVNQPPCWTGPHQPRLDWQMWFASLGSWRESPWLLSLMERLLQGEPSVEKLLGRNPFKGHPPNYIQATFWEYHFTNFKTKGAHGPWWRRASRGLYCPTVSLR